MYKRYDSEKRIDLEIQQQIANFNNSMSRINETLQSLQNQINDLKSYEKKRHDALETRCQAIESDIEEMKAYNISNVKQFYSSINDTIAKISQLNMIVKDSQNLFRDSMKDNKDIRIDIEEIEHAFKDHEDGLKQVLDGINHRIYDLESKSKKELERFKEEIFSRPSITESVIDSLNDKINSHKVDVVGLMRELTFFKKNLFVIEKQIENIYTLLKRIGVEI